MNRRPDLRSSAASRPGATGAGPRRGRGRDEGGQAIVELALALPILALLLGVAFNGWNGMQLSVRLTSAARAGAIQAANDLGTNPTDTQTAWNDAVTAVNEEEGVNTLYQNVNAAANDYVTLSTSTESVSGGITMHVVTITIRETTSSLVPVVASFPVTAHATARYS
ncbi:MAG TPA: TadE/TadG family type IV pilus assembly protein [Acidimicrobiales bacterium]|nr:TadE/TadG family type IV pilus assembly protein [Acidimicrobiales bacterium]